MIDSAHAPLALCGPAPTADIHLPRALAALHTNFGLDIEKGHVHELHA
jgi:hypothetical protein